MNPSVILVQKHIMHTSIKVELLNAWNIHLCDKTLGSWSKFNPKSKLCDLNAVCSLNFSSAGKRPFMDSKAKSIYFSGGGG